MVLACIATQSMEHFIKIGVYVARVDTTWGIESFVRIQYAYHVQPRSRGGK